MLDTKAQITRSLSKLIGLPLAIARDAASMKNFGLIEEYISLRQQVEEDNRNLKKMQG